MYNCVRRSLFLIVSVCCCFCLFVVAIKTPHSITDVSLLRLHIEPAGGAVTSGHYTRAAPAVNMHDVTGSPDGVGGAFLPLCVFAVVCVQKKQLRDIHDD